MKTGILLIATLSLIIISCGKSDDADDKAGQAEKVTTVPPAVMNDSPVTDEDAGVGDESVTAEMIESVPEQATDTVDGESVYRKSCASCHMTGAAGAPRTGDEAAWSPRISKGIDALVESALAGVPGTAMMARGACATCSDAEIEAAVHYMADQIQ